MKVLRELLAAAAACLLAVHLVSGAALNFRQASLHCNRLPINVMPTKYDLHLIFPSLDSNFYEGHVDIDVEFLNKRADKVAAWGLKNVDCAWNYDERVIMMHADKSIEIDNIEVSSEPLWPFICGAEQKSRQIVEVVRDEAEQMIAIRVERGLHGSSHGTPGRISLDFKGRMREDKRGVYVSTYDDGEQIFKHIVSQFQPTDARTVFPSFDEPRFRVPFSVRVTHPKALTAYGNTEVQQLESAGAYSTTQFVTTPNMPIHMLAFTVGQFDEPLEVSSRREHSDQAGGAPKSRKIRVITAPGKRETGRFALEVAKNSLEWFEKYIDYDFPLDKLDVIAIADHDKDNTESWGLVFVRDVLVWIDDETKTDTRITTAVNVAHVVVHQWFGNLISVNWWSDLWITEGVAAQFAFNIVQQLYPSLQSEFFVRLATLSGIMQLDQPGKQHALSPAADQLRTSEQIYSIFDNLSFMKSGSLAQMTKEILGNSNYRHLLSSLVKRHAYKAINFQHYQRALWRLYAMGIRDDLNALELVQTFSKYTGVPLIDCNLKRNSSGHTLQLTSEPFAQASNKVQSDHPSHELAPLLLQVTVEVGHGHYTDRLVRHNIRDKDENMHNELKMFPSFGSYEPKMNYFIKIDHDPSIANYYRTRYSEALYKSLENAIQKEFISDMGRLQILDDANNLAQAHLIAPSQLRTLLDSYADEQHPAVVLAIMAATKTYKSLAPNDQDSMPSEAAIVRIFHKYGFKVEGKQELTLQRARSVVLKTLIQQGNTKALADALEAFDEANGQLVPFLREPIYTAVVLSGGERVNQLLRHLSETKSYEERIRLLSALTLSKDKPVLVQVKSWLESSGLKTETAKPFLEAISRGLSE